MGTDLSLGAAITTPGSSRNFKTGNWREGIKPVIDFKKCKHCFICFHFCPEGAIKGAGGKIVAVDYDFCKGCGICVNECPFDAIKFEEDK